MQLIDTHVHINFPDFQADLVGLGDRWRAAGVVRLVHACVKPADFPQMQALADRFPELSLAVGLHPLDAKLWQSDTAAQIHDCATGDSRVVAIGEMGLDFFKADDREWQIEVFRQQLAIARSLSLPVIIHCRDAAVEMREVMQSEWQERGAVAGVMHCWAGTPEETKWFLDLGMYVSFSGVVTFKNATGIRDSLQTVPDERLLVETDCPFLAPVPRRGKRNEPSFVRHVAECVAETRGISLSELAAITTANACRLFAFEVDRGLVTPR
jgi:TatD DNase family protein